MFIAEKALTIPTAQVNLRGGEHLSKEFKRINPFATVPVLELDDGTRLNSTAGCRAYLESLHPTPALLGRDDKERGVVADQIWRIETDGITAVAEALRNRSKGMKDRALTGPDNYPQIPELAERGRLRAQRFMSSLDQIIGPKDFVCGDVLTAADIDAYVFVEFAKWIKIAVPDGCDNVQRWYQNISSRPSASL